MLALSHHSLYIFLHLILVKFCQPSLYFIFTVQINNNIDLYIKFVKIIYILIFNIYYRAILCNNKI